MTIVFCLQEWPTQSNMNALGTEQEIWMLNWAMFHANSWRNFFLKTSNFCIGQKVAQWWTNRQVYLLLHVKRELIYTFIRARSNQWPLIPNLLIWGLRQVFFHVRWTWYSPNKLHSFRYSPNFYICIALTPAPTISGLFQC